eukprot:TRINITY_DN23946_c0_g1_i1.p1 TRINITY_DN23946_c0_g1~~TRINITY_DN23946_c0_g1_i1.p1  ORF type:complete len:520 (-),score=103.86 TRINITY_DN23946_c0_g1_i1:380-1726(-)
MVAPAEYFQGNLPPGAMLVPASQFHPNFMGAIVMPAGHFQNNCAVLNANFQPQTEGSVMMQQACQDEVIRPAELCNIGNTGYPPTHQVAYDSSDIAASDSFSDKARSLDEDVQALVRRGDSDWKAPLDQHEDASAAEPRLTTSAARRLRRKRAMERFREDCAMVTAAGQLSSGCHAAEVLDAEGQDELQRKLREGGRENVEHVFAAIRGHVWKLSRDASGCRLVQLVLEQAHQHEAVELAQELRGHVREAATSPHANYVLQKIVSQLTFNTAKFVAEELGGACARIARHRYGCRIFCRLLEFFGGESSVLGLMEELLSEAEDLCSHCFAHHIVQTLIEHGTEVHRRRVAAALLTNPMAYAQHKNASYLVERALSYCCQEDKRALLAKLSQPDAIAVLAVTQFGSYVVRSVLRHEQVSTSAAMEQIRDLIPQLRKTKHGQHLLTDLGCE